MPMGILALARYDVLPAIGCVEKEGAEARGAPRCYCNESLVARHSTTITDPNWAIEWHTFAADATSITSTTFRSY
jgi:hypothetical protein